MYILQDKRDKRMFYKGINEAYSRRAYTYIKENALVFDNIDEAQMVADDIQADIIEIKGQPKKSKPKKQKLKLKESTNGQFGFDI